MRGVGLVGLVGLVACGTHAAAPTPPPAPRAVPGARLPDDAVPLGYDLRLEVDPDSDAFTGAVVIRVRVRGTDRVWLHASGLAIASASWTRDGVRHPSAVVAEADELRAFDLGEVITGDIELAIAYAGTTGKNEEGLFRQQDRGRWYLYSQAESVFARRFVPCFDEPRWKVPWQVTVVAPADDVALANAPELGREPAGARIAHRFAPTPPLASYLLAIAVGPFAVVDAGTAGDLPLRAVVLAGDADRAGVVAATVPALVAALEAYVGSKLPWPKLDFVAVPHLFGAMENPGLITFDRALLAGDAGAPRFRAHFVRIALHELAHMWFGNSVTPPWWDDLWLAEAFAQWLADKLASQLHAYDDEVAQRGLARERALAADDAVDARPLHHAVASGADAETQFDAISYEKGSALLASFERVAGEAAWRTGIRRYLAAHAGGTATTADLLAALAQATSPALARALGVDVDRAGAPIVTLRSTCHDISAPKLIATARNGIVPMCFRSSVQGCVLVDGKLDLPVPTQARGTGCPSFSIANDGGLGYYDAVDDASPARTPAEQLAHGDDLAAALRRGELRADRAGIEVKKLATGDAYAQLGALAIARALAPSAEPAAFAAWLGGLFAARLTPMALLAPAGEAERQVRDALLDLATLPPMDTRALTAALAADRASPLQVVIAAPGGGLALFEEVRAAVARAHGEMRDELIDALGAFGPDVAPRAIELAAQGELPTAVAIAYLERPRTRAAAWTAVRAHLAELLAVAAPVQGKALIAALGNLCEARAEVAAAVLPHVGDVLDGKRTLEVALATIDRCSARRAAAGTFAP